jgi:hypothetical protein
MPIVDFENETMGVLQAINKLSSKPDEEKAVVGSMLGNLKIGGGAKKGGPNSPGNNAAGGTIGEKGITVNIMSIALPREGRLGRRVSLTPISLKENYDIRLGGDSSYAYLSVIHHLIRMIFTELKF